jgi:hypothetical protein
MFNSTKSLLGKCLAAWLKGRFAEYRFYVFAIVKVWSAEGQSGGLWTEWKGSANRIIHRKSYWTFSRARATRGSEVLIH